VLELKSANFGVSTPARPFTTGIGYISGLVLSVVTLREKQLHPGTYRVDWAQFGHTIEIMFPSNFHVPIA